MKPYFDRNRRELDYENVISIEDGIKQLQEEFDQKQKEK